VLQLRDERDQLRATRAPQWEAVLRDAVEPAFALCLVLVPGSSTRACQGGHSEDVARGVEVLLKHSKQVAVTAAGEPDENS
jgi:hypothetical protein